MTPHDQHTHRILDEIGAGGAMSQRSLSRELGIALGLTNLLIRKLVGKGWVRATAIKPNRMAYFLTPAGFAEKTRMSRDAMQNSVRFYRDARDRIRTNFSDLSRRWPVDAAEPAVPKRVLFLGTGEVAEIGYVCLQETDLQLVGAVDFQGRERFFEVPVYAASTLDRESIERLECGRVVVMSFEDSEQIRAVLDRVGWPPERVSWM